MADANFGTYEQVCGNGIDEELFNRVVDVLQNNNCDKRGDDMMLFQNSDYNVVAEDKDNEIRYDMNEGFCVSRGSGFDTFFYWLLVFLFIFLIYWVIVAPNQTPLQIAQGAVAGVSSAVCPPCVK